MYAFDRSPYGVDVGKWFTHSHKYDVVDAAILHLGNPRTANDLFNDLARSEMSRESCLSGRTEATPHCTPCLRADTDGRTIFVVHKHSLDWVVSIN